MIHPLTVRSCLTIAVLGLPFSAASAEDAAPPSRVALVRAGVVLKLAGGWDVSQGPVTRPGEEKLLTLGLRVADWEGWRFVCSIRMKDAPVKNPKLSKVAAALKKLWNATFQKVKIIGEGPRRIAGFRGYALEGSMQMYGRPSRAMHCWFANGRRVVQFSMLTSEADAKEGRVALINLIDAIRPLKPARGLKVTDLALRRAVEATARIRKQATAEKLAGLAGPPAWFLIQQGELVLGAAGYEISAEHGGKGFRSTSHLWFRSLKGDGFAQTITKTATAGGSEEVFSYKRRILANGKPTGDEETINAVVRDGRLSAERVRGEAIDHLQVELPATYVPQTLSGLFHRYFARFGRGQVLLTEFDFANFRIQDVLLASTGREAIILAGRPRPAVRTVLLKMVEGQVIITHHDPATGAPLRRALGPLALRPATLATVRKHFPQFAR